jgi:hypothetical protein
MRRKTKLPPGIQDALTEHLVEGWKAIRKHTQDCIEAEFARRAPRDDCQGERAYATEIASKSPSPFEMVDDAAGRVGSFADRLNTLAARLVGELPSGCDANAKPGRSGQLGTVADRADNIFYAVNAMHAALDRIEQQLP